MQLTSGRTPLIICRCLVFNESGALIHYTIEETVPGGYTRTEELQTPTTGTFGTITYENGEPLTGDEAYKSEIQTVDAETGKTIFEGLRPGRYKLEEVEAPVGYLVYESPWFITIDAAGIAT